ncbi:hypothetical protein PINS_up001325 [Pythium insidiosum]|nr:hypothetical protein PINS_up001325 [Pythium insidiosum]
MCPSTSSRLRLASSGSRHCKELNIGFNRLSDVSVLEFCPLLRRVNLSGNRLLNTRGLETLVHLEHLNLSDNLIEL